MRGESHQLCAEYGGPAKMQNDLARVQQNRGIAKQQGGDLARCCKSTQTLQMRRDRANILRRSRW
jgi:hypothetical protein